MRRGEFSAAWALSDALLGVPQDHRTTPRHQQQIWRGAPLRGRVLVRCYHGLGDTIQFIRYAPLIKNTANHVTVWAQRSLLKILSTVSGIDRLLPLHDGVCEGDYDVEVEVMELPHVFRTTIETIPARVPYLAAPPLAADVTRAAPRDTDLRVGFMWRSGEWDPARSIPFHAIAPLCTMRGVHAVPLALGVNDAHGRYFDSRPPIGTIESLANTIASLDLVITVDTMAAHLAGALAVPTWLLLHSEPDWRWMADRADTPWYPFTAIYRQSSAGEWLPVLERVQSDLEVAARRRRRTRA